MGVGLPDIQGSGPGLQSATQPAAASIRSADSPASIGDTEPAPTFEIQVVTSESTPITTPTRCGSEPGSIRAHRDDIAVHPEREASGPCRLAGPKRVHGTDRRPDTVGQEALSEPAATTKLASASPRWSGGFNLYRKTAFVTQKDFTWCVAAMRSISPSPVQVAFTFRPHSSSSAFTLQTSPPML